MAVRHLDLSCVCARRLFDLSEKARTFIGASVLISTAMMTAGVWLGHRLDPTRSASAATLARRFCGSAGAQGTPPRLAPFVATDQSAALLSDRDLLGHVWVADFIFTRCRGLCPLLSARLASLRGEMKDERIRFISFTIDPEHDTPGVLAAYGRSWATNDGRWRLLRTDRATLSRIAGSLDPAAVGSVDASTHSDRFFLIDSRGGIRGSFGSADPGDQKCLSEALHDLIAWGE